jgi:hexosaminidase
MKSMLAICLATSALFAAELRVVPYPRKVETTDARMPLRGTVTIGVASNDPEDRFAAGLLAEEIESAAKVKVRISGGSGGQIVLTRKGAATELGDEGYTIEATAKSVRVTARTAAGIFYGVQTLRQMVEPTGIRGANISDWPAMRWRGLHDDLSRGPVPTTDYIKRQIRTSAEYKVNLYSFYIEHTYAYKNEPLIGPPGGSLTEDEVKELIKYARQYHVDLVPEQQTFGHLHHVLKFEKYADMAETPYGHVLSPANPKTYEFIKSLYAEIVPLYPGPFLHVGGDETAELGQGQTKDMADKQGVGRVYFDHMKKVSEILAPYKKRLMFWGDIALNHPEFLKDLPKDIIVMSWGYNAAPSYDRQIKPFRDAGLDLMVCPGVNNWNRIFPNLDQAIPNIRVFTREGQKAGAIGQFNTTWDDYGDALFGMTWYPVVFGAAAAWQQGDSDPERFRAAFDWAFFRNPGDEFSRAIMKINSAHGLLGSVGLGDANYNTVAWLNPFDANERKTLARIQPIASTMRLNEEEAIELIEKNRPKARRNADLLDYHVFSARRLDFVGMKAIYSKIMADAWKDAYENQDTPGRITRATGKINGVNGLLQDGRDYTTALAAEYRRLWLAENRAYWLGNVMALYDRETRVWLDEIEVIRKATAAYRSNRLLPPAEAVGLKTAP